MKDQGTKSRYLLIISIGLILVTVIVVSAYLYRTEQQQRTIDVGQLIDEGIASSGKSNTSRACRPWAVFQQTSLMTGAFRTIWAPPWFS